MSHPITIRRADVLANLRAAGLAIAAALVGAILVQHDRRVPFDYISSAITPVPAIEGQTAMIDRQVRWHRNCDGEIFREIVKPGGEIVFYDRGYRPFPYMLGEHHARSSFILPKDMLPVGTNSGLALYRGRVRFRECGLTSRVWPIEVPFQVIEFEVARR